MFTFLDQLLSEINSHGILALLAGWVLVTIIGTMPELPDTATWTQKWIYAAIHAFGGNASNLAKAILQPARKRELNGIVKLDKEVK